MMGSYDGAELCELVGLFLLNEITNKRKIITNVGLYRDDGLGVIENGTGREMDKTRKSLVAFFKLHKLEIEVICNKKLVDFLDITMNLNDGTHRPYNKPNNDPLYAHQQSNHPPSILK